MPDPQNLTARGAYDIRRLGPESAAMIAELGRQTFVDAFGAAYEAEDLAVFLAEAYAEPLIASWLGDPRLACFAAFRSGEPKRAVGYALAGPSAFDHAGETPAPGPMPGAIKRLYILAAHQGGGLGVRLLAMSIRWLDEQGYRPIYLSAAADNFGAQRLYQRHGFEIVREFAFMVGRHADREFLMVRRG